VIADALVARYPGWARIVYALVGCLFLYSSLDWEFSRERPVATLALAVLVILGSSEVWLRRTEFRAEWLEHRDMFGRVRRMPYAELTQIEVVPGEYTRLVPITGRPVRVWALEAKSTDLLELLSKSLAQLSPARELRGQSSPARNVFRVVEQHS
jgi:hypothetical protein